MLEKTGSWLVEGGDGNEVGRTGQAKVSGASAGTGNDTLCNGAGTFCIVVDIVVVVAVAVAVVTIDAEAAVCASKVEIPTEMDVADKPEEAAVGRIEGDIFPSCICLIWLIWLI